MNVSNKQLQTLRAIKSRIEELIQARADLPPGTPNYEIERQHGQGYLDELKLADTSGCQMRFESIFGFLPTPSQSASHSRCMRQLTAAGLIEPNFVDRRHQKLTRPNFVKLSPAGEEVLRHAEDAQ